jgi:hypothetical protein
MNDRISFLITSSELTQIDVNQLKIDMYISELNCPWLVQDSLVTE